MARIRPKSSVEGSFLRPQAEALAGRQLESRQSGVNMQVIVVRVRGETFGVPAQHVTEIIRAVAVSPLPGSPTVISGVINVRGTPVVVIDPAVRFGKAEMPVKPDDNFILVRTEARTIAVRVDIAEDLIDVDDSVLTAPRSASSAVDKIHGIAAMPDGALVIYDTAAFLTQAEDEAIAQALAAAESAS
jgi:purine-binding chemotaxis protein CheW